MGFSSLQEMEEQCLREKKEFWELVLEDDCLERGVTKKESLAQMELTWHAILHAAASYEKDRESASGLVGKDGYRMEVYAQKNGSLCGEFINAVMAHALQMSESNACMKRIVAAPTAGSCGVLPAVLVPYFKNGRAALEEILKAMYVSAGIGQVIAARASISGAEGGCQAEIGSASAMAAAAMTYLQGGNTSQLIHAAAMALKGLLGLVCDPVAGLVEIPCVKRNVIGAVNALSCTDMAMAGIVSRIPADQVIDAMKEIGDKMDPSFKETAKGGLARTPAALQLESQVKKTIG